MSENYSIVQVLENYKKELIKEYCLINPSITYDDFINCKTKKMQSKNILDGDFIRSLDKSETVYYIAHLIRVINDQKVKYKNQTLSEIVYNKLMAVFDSFINRQIAFNKGWIKRRDDKYIEYLIEPILKS